MQQGDPPGPLLFSLAIHPLAVELASQGRDGNAGAPLDLTFFYLDDGVVCGSPQAVADALATLSHRAGQLGLSLNLGKCELVSAAEVAPAVLDRLFPRELLLDTAASSPTFGQPRVLLNGCFDFLGAPIGSAAHCAAHTRERIEKALPLLGAIGNLEDPQVALRPRFLQGRVQRARRS